MKTKRFLSLALALAMASGLASMSSARFMGDVNNDGDVNSSDALAVLRYAVGTTDNMDTRYADMNGDGDINSSDALEILRTSVGSLDKVEGPEESADIPDTAEEILAVYNNAVNKAVDENAGYTKERTTTVKKIDAGSFTSAASGVVKDFLGEGTNTFTNKKGSANYLKNSTLEVSDLTQVKCEVSGSTYTVTLYLKDGVSSTSKSSHKDNSPLAKCGLVTGKIVDTNVDYINSQCIYASIAAENISVEKVAAATKNAQIVVVVDKETGNLLSYTASFEWGAEISNLKVSLIKVSKATGEALTSVEFSDFKW